MDGYETINDYSLLEQVRDAIEDIDLAKINQNLDISDHDHDQLLFTQILEKMDATSKASKERIHGAFLEIKAHQNYYKQHYKIKQKSNRALTPALDDIDNIQMSDHTQNLKGYKGLIKSFRDRIKPVLILTNNTFKTKTHLVEECKNENCEIHAQKLKKSFIEICPCAQRIECVLETYQNLKDNDSLWCKVSISSIFCITNIYGYQQLVDDFLHLRIVHLDKNEENTTELCERFEEKYFCDLKKCIIFSRHYRDRTNVQKARNLYYHNKIDTEYGVNKALDIKNDKDIIFQQEIDKIHSYFLHSTLKFGKGKYFQNRFDTDFTRRKNEINAAAKGRSYSIKQNKNKNHKIFEMKLSNINISPSFPKKSRSTVSPPNSKHKIKTNSYGSIEWSEMILNGRKFAHQSAFELNNNRHIRNSSDNTNERSCKKLVIMPEEITFAKTNPVNIGISEDILERKSISPTPSCINCEINPEYQKENNYVGISEDKQWLEKINTCASNEEIYNKLVQFCGIFRWQNAHGFRSRHFQGLGHIQSRFANIKDEVLHNDYHSITTENWNQTLRKSKAFHNSWAAAKIRALYGGQFEDQITKSRFIWKKYDQIELKEIVTLKLYTDFDKLQFELKKCFRWEYTQEIVENNSVAFEENKYDIDEETKGGNSERILIDRTQKQQLCHRLEQFYHWRQSLVVILNKYGHKIRAKDSNYILYHGVNAKMILNPAITPAFYGPLSTSSSFHVAKTFATDKGMVLTISSQYPRLGVCRAFDASLISDYPEEQEWLIGFIYTRIRKVHTKETFAWQRLPPASNLRFVFFALHLFRMQMFSMSDDLEEILIEIFLEKDSKTNQKYRAAKTSANKNSINYRKAKILSILQNKFDEFRGTPNTKQIIRLDDISQNLRKYFLDCEEVMDIHKKIDSNSHSHSQIDAEICQIQTTEMTDFDSDYCDCEVSQSFLASPTRSITINFNADSDNEQELDPFMNTSNMKYSVSFEKIKSIFRNLREIHFYNYYKCDNVCLRKLVSFVKKDINSHLRQVKFLYYDYSEDNIIANKYFFDPSLWEQSLLNELDAHGYHIRHQKIMHYGYKIRIYKNV